jgi:acetyl esterase
VGRRRYPDVDVDEVHLPVREKVARCALYRPEAAPVDEPLPVIVYHHGGGFTVGTSEDRDFLARKLSFTNRALVVSANHLVSANHRFAPDFMFPIPLDDYRWVSGNAELLGEEPSRIVLAGNSFAGQIA